MISVAPSPAANNWQPNRQDLLANLGLSLGFAASLAFAGESALSLLNAGMPAGCAEYASNVSHSEGNFNSVSPVVNGTRCYGAFQFCDSGTLQAYWDGSREDFLNNPSAQVAAWERYQRGQWNAAQKNGMTSLIGQQVCYQGTCATISQSSILKACQFGCGTGGKLYNLAKSGLDCSAAGTRDGAGTSVCAYLISGAGYNVGCITNSDDGVDCAPISAKEVQE
ncbi:MULTISPECIES: acyltransferase [Rhizobium]|uniref:Acyltransferase n=1 Tax=Rhizobium rhododendri TaxID=2506430 RepID=A0ABY8ITM4_9HYPH|nr:MULTISPECIES: acyltransferase [Rhizobium]MBZ5763373.1 acyltransferase [Rhizobium sp. VS19-DR96]MBZ5769257.1 acyltransferase [Rhizobium sp. VS19-DR129.2]MBZ5776803.1 acyltransferase [Rhizobium sp. VS19-DRK62.2]MBZ5787892.1 acyltransferase [Rhizobium sp. VS19-DR121]MBZ5805393.1 acyltransferase [Rhizobium sp. VS19-DR181]